jgi:hypothetical protein
MNCSRAHQQALRLRICGNQLRRRKRHTGGCECADQSPIIERENALLGADQQRGVTFWFKQILDGGFAIALYVQASAVIAAPAANGLSSQ